jgi:hypothetical protein
MTHVFGLILVTGFALCQLDTRGERENSTRAIEKIAFKVVRDQKLENKPVIELVFREAVSEETLTGLRSFSDLKVLDLACTNITDDGLKHLKSLKKLEVLKLDLTHITEDGLDQLNGLSNLHTLSLFVTSVSAEGISHLKEFKQLRLLHLDRETELEKEIAELCKALPQLKVDRGNGNSAEKRVRKYFTIPDSKGVNQSTIRSAILTRLPIGSSIEKVNEFLKATGLDKDRHSGIHPIEQGRIVCRIGYDPESGWIVHKSYAIVFLIDAQKELTEIEVREWLTGP